MNNQYGQGNAFIKQETASGATAATLVTPPAATSFESYTLNTTLNGATETVVVVTTAPPTSLGTRGTILVTSDYGVKNTFSYTNRSGATFTLDTSGPQRFLNEASTVATTALTGAAEVFVEVAAIAAETPQKGKLRITLDSAATVDVVFTSWSGTTFTIETTDFSGDNASIGNATLTLLQATAGVHIAVGNENRVIVRGWSVNATNTAGTASTVALQTNAATPAEVLKGNLLATTGTYQSDTSGAHIPLPAGESLDIKGSQTGVTADVTVWGEFAPHGVPQCTGYVYGTP